jgi:hypothetical protein
MGDIGRFMRHRERSEGGRKIRRDPKNGHEGPGR